MWSISIKESIKIIAITILAMILGLIIQIYVLSGGLDSLSRIMSDSSVLVDTIMGIFSFTVGQLSVFVILLMMFAFSASLLRSIAYILGATPSVSAPKPKKEKKKKEKKKPKKEEKPAAPQPEEPVVDTGNYCKICGKPIPLGRAICKNCEAILRGEAPSTQQQSGQSEGG
ncbi:MAG: hypothetical protein Q6363_000880 [Candidatus Njordarchaeota archaeon]